MSEDATDLELRREGTLFDDKLVLSADFAVPFVFIFPLFSFVFSAPGLAPFPAALPLEGAVFLVAPTAFFPAMLLEVEGR